MLTALDGIVPHFACPRCHKDLRRQGNKLICVESCGVEDFEIIEEKPVLIDFEKSIVDRDTFFKSQGASVISRDIERKTAISGLRRRLLGTNTAAERFSRRIVEDLSAVKTPRILVVGGGAVGKGMQALYDAPVELVGTDIFLTANTALAADGHHLPFQDSTFDGVWIQAVLEHVLEPHVVVGEIWRVLKPGGLVYADTPFMQQVHEGAYDFTRFTVSGHRWLFRKFDLIDAGCSAGADIGLIWSLQYFVRALTGSQKAGTASSLLFSWLRLFSRFTKRRENNDAASGVYFYGRRSERELHPKEIVGFYAEQRNAPRVA